MFDYTKFTPKQTEKAEEESIEEFLASDPSEEFRSRGNSIQGNEMITLQRNNTTTGTSTPKGVQFLRPMHVTPEGVKAIIVKATADKPDNFGNPVVVDFSFNGGKYRKGFKLTSDNLASIVDIHGADESKWAKKPIMIAKSVDDDGGERLVFRK